MNDPALPIANHPRPVPVDALTSLRGLAAVWVVVLHFKGDLFHLFPTLIVADPLLGLGHIAVPYFFILSGFVLAYNYAADFPRVAPATYLPFIGRRFGRIYPVHLFTLLCVLAFVLLSQFVGISINRADKYSADDFVLNLFLVQTWVANYQLNWNGPAWSISSEWFAYLLFPFCCVALNRIKGPWLAGAVVVGCWLASVALYTLGSDMPFFTLLIVVPTFLTGCAIWRCLAVRCDRPAVPRWLPDLLIVAVLVTPFLVSGLTDWSDEMKARVVLVCMLAYFAGTIFCFAALGNSCSGIWISRPLVFLGEISYSLYMTHALVLMVCAKWLPSQRFAEATLTVRIGVLLAYVGLVAMAAGATYFVVENPSRRYLSRLLSSRPSRLEGPARTNEPLEFTPEG